MMKPMRMIAALLAMLAGTAPAIAADWRQVSSDDAGRNFIDFATLKKTGHTVSFEALMVFSRRAPSGFDNARVRLDADCSTHSYLMRSRRFYFGAHFLRDTGDAPRAVAEPDSRIFDMIQAACGVGRTTAVKDPFARPR
jgi:hypothetical protein